MRRLLLLPALLPLLACTSPIDSPHVLLITLDTTRRDHCSVYGYASPTTPRLERLAAEGVRFDAAYAPMASTAPTHATLFTSLYPVAHRVVKNGIPLAEPFGTLAERLHAEGYQTAAVVSSFVLDRKFGFAQGFDAYEDAFTVEGSTVRIEHWQDHRVDGRFDRRADAATDRAIEWLERERTAGERFLLFVHYFDPHAPYVPPETWAERFTPAGPAAEEPLARVTARYDAEIAFADHEIGRLLDALDALGLADNTLVWVTADHGEGLAQHGHMEHGVSIYEEQVRVPLIARWPAGLPAGAVIVEPVGVVDLLPTLLELLGLAAPPDAFQGRSLAGSMKGGARLPPDRPIWLHRRHYEEGVVGQIPVKGEQFGVRLLDWKYIVAPDEGTAQLYDLSRDPGETHDRMADAPAKATELAGRLEAFLATHTRELPSTTELSDADRQRLRALGYVE